jgi:chemotaxis protein methyltransferase CheR
VSRAQVSHADVAGFSQQVEREFGHQPDERRSNDLQKLLEARILATASTSYAVYQERLKPGSAEWERLAPLLTVPETYFFRMPGHFNALAEEVIPRLLRTNRESRTLRLLSAGCASGEEAYTLRIVLNERFPELRDWDVSIVGFDLSDAAIARARDAIYSEWSLRATSPERRRVNFTPAGKQFRLNPAASAGVSFERRNLRQAAAPGEPLFDVIFCRNVLIYFSENAIAEVVCRLSERLQSCGYLFLGPAESLRGVSRDFRLCQAHDTFFYRRRERGFAGLASPSIRRTLRSADGEMRALSAGSENHTLQNRQEASGSGSDLQGSWYDNIRSSSERLAGLIEPRKPKAAQATMPLPLKGLRTGNTQAAHPAQPPDRCAGDALALHRQERFADALALLDSNAATHNAKARKPAAREQATLAVLRAVMLVNLARCPEAESACHAALALQPASPGAHFLLGLCAEQASRLEEAERELSAAVLLDPDFSMGYLHLGRVVRRRGESGAAQAAFGKALRALDRDFDDRLLLFGGGFSRGSLRDLCLREQARTGSA